MKDADQQHVTDGCPPCPESVGSAHVVVEPAASTYNASHFG